MTAKEMSDALDSLLNSYANATSFGEESSKLDITLDEYEKSLYLTQAQDIVLKSYFQRATNSEGVGFDDSEKRQVDFSSLITTKSITSRASSGTAFDERGILFDMPKRADEYGASVSGTTDVLLILNEQLITKVGTPPEDGEVDRRLTKTYVVVPINYKEYDKEMSKPYAQPLKKQVWRLFQSSGSGFDYRSEIIPVWDLEDRETIYCYKIRYLRRPKPIVLIGLSESTFAANPSIEGFTSETSCELNPILHPEVVQKAADIIIASRGRATQAQR